jgi:hypothetical protein
MKRWGIMCMLILLLPATSGAGRKSHARAKKRNGGSLSQPFAPQFMGMHTLSPTRHWPSVPFGSMRPAGTTWGAVEPTQGHFDWHGVDTWVAASQAHGVQLDYVFLNTPQWASTHPDEHCNRGPIGCAAPPTDKAWTEFVTTLVRRYKGKIASYEMWNEPNAIGFFTGSPTDMAHLVAVAYPIIKSIDPSAIVVSPAPSSTGWPTPYDTWLDQFLAAGGGKYVDVIAWHAYAGRANQPALPPEEVVDQIEKVRAVMAKHRVSDLPLWDTEGGWGSDSQLPDEQAQADFLARWYLIQFTHGVARAYWYQWNNPKWGTLWRDGTGQTPAARAYEHVYHWLDGASGSTPCAAKKGPIWTCSLFKGNNQYLIVWSQTGHGKFSDYRSFSSYVDLTGEKHPSTGQPLAVSSSPILFQRQ